jgi:hypothetical protein
MPQAMIIGGNYCIIRPITPFQKSYFLVHSYTISILFEFLANKFSNGSINKIIKYRIKYTKVEPKFLIRILVEKPFSSKNGFNAVSSSEF